MSFQSVSSVPLVLEQALGFQLFEKIILCSLYWFAAQQQTGAIKRLNFSV